MNSDTAPQHDPLEQPSNMTYNIPLEVGFNDVRDCRIDRETTCADVLLALLGRPSASATSNWAILETVYEHGTLQTEVPVKKSLKLVKNTKQQTRQPQLVIKELRLLNPKQLMYELVSDVCPLPSSRVRSVLSVINASCETVVFFNPYFRMLTGIPLGHVSMFPDPDMTVGVLNKMIKVKLGLAADDNRFALFGNYGKHIAQLEERCIVSELKATWEGKYELGKGLENADCRIGFFQFQCTPESADHELLGIDRASWLYVKRESGVFRSTKKRYAVLKGTSLYIYTSEKQEPEGRLVIKNVDACKVYNMGSNLVHSRYFFQIVESVKVPNKQQAITWTFCSPYQSRVRKWLKCLGKCRRCYEMNVPSTYEDPDGHEWINRGRYAIDRLQPFSKQSYSKRNKIDPNAVPAGQMTIEQRSRFDHIDALLRTVQMSGDVVKQSGLGMSAELVEGWMAKVREFSLEATSLARPGFAQKMLPLATRMLRGVNKFSPALQGSLRENYMDVDDVQIVMEACTDMCNVYKQHVLDLASFPASPKSNELEFGPQMISLRMLLDSSDYYTHVIPDTEASVAASDAVIAPECVQTAPADGQKEDELIDLQELADAETVDASVAVDTEATIDAQNDQLEEQPTVNRKSKKSLVKKMKSLLISTRPHGPKVHPSKPTSRQPEASQEVQEELDSSVAASDFLSAAPSATVNETRAPVPARTSSCAVGVDDAVSVKSHASSFSARMRGLWDRVSSPKPGAKEDDLRKMKPTANIPAARESVEFEYFTKPQTYHSQPQKHQFYTQSQQPQQQMYYQPQYYQQPYAYDPKMMMQQNNQGMPQQGMVPVYVDPTFFMNYMMSMGGRSQ